MKRFVSILLAAMILLQCGCTADSQENTPKEFAENTSAALPDPEAWRSQNAPLVSFVETDLGYYILENRMLYFAPTGSAEFHILCSRPDCEHNNEDCNAFAGEAFTYYDRKLYSVLFGDPSIAFQVISMSLDGSDHQVVGHFREVLYPDGGTSGAQSFSMSGRYIYYVVANGAHTGESGYETHFFRMDLTTGKSEELPGSFESERCTDGFYYQHDGNKWYFIASHILEDGTRTPDYLACVDMEAGTYTPIMEGGYTRFDFYRLEGRTILHYQVGQGFFSYDMDSGEDKCLLALTDEDTYGLSSAFYDTDYIYLKANEELQIFDRNYQLIDRVAIPNNVFYITATQDLALFGIYLEAGMKPTAYISKSDIGSGSLELISIDG
ncbi:MAG: hypothetical protein SOY32_06300 [Candidatus Faecousia sp.]|nr:hypothetical protein [Bacillota bacterium]MDY4220013.1 hypothetical protein [Candidatus Faecousia sp.]